MSKPTRASIIIREGRKRAGLTQQELADKLGITTGAVSNYENGVSFPKAEIAFGLWDILDITPRELFESEWDWERSASKPNKNPRKARREATFRGFYSGATDPIRTDDLLITSYKRDF